MKRDTAILIALAMMFPSLGWADEDEPGRGVARISLINGDVSVRRGDSGAWVAAAVNAPLVVSDHVVTGPNSRAEVQFDWANMVRLASNSEIRLAELEHRRYQVQLARGTVTLRVLRDSEAEIEVNTPSVSVRPERKGAYRITVTDEERTEITARSGEAEVYTPNGVERLRSGKTILVRGSPGNPEFQIVNATPRDEWDRWNEDRDRRLESARSYRYVSRDIYGAEDLDYHGRWIYVPPYGWVWSPYGIGYDWAPYRHGRWVWIDWYGWSWLSYDPWGWAPYHYGRWFWHAHYRWCWYPGPIHHRHYWRPALVAFFGVRVGGVSLGFGFGRVGWVPLAPYEPYHPWYGWHYYGGFRRHSYVDNSVRIVNNVNITNIYRNARVVNAVSGVDAGDFVRGGRIRSVRLSDAEFRNASLVQGPVPVAPAAESVRFSDREVPIANLPRTDRERFYSRRTPAPVERVPFEEQRRGMEQVVRRAFGSPAEIDTTGSVRAGGDPGRGISRIESGNLPRANEPRIWRAETATPGSNNPPRTESGGWRRIGEGRTESGNLVRSGAEQRGWRRFGEPVNRTESEPANLPRATDRGRPRGLESGDQSGTRGGESSGWRRFEPAQRGEGGSAIPRSNRPGRDERAAPRESEPQGGFSGRPDEGWRRFESPAHTEQPSPRGDSTRWGSPRFDRGRDAEPRSTERVVINPPIVRERASPRFEHRGGFGQWPNTDGRTGGGIRSTPGMSRGGGDIPGGSGSVRSGGEIRGSRGESRGGGATRSESHGRSGVGRGR